MFDKLVRECELWWKDTHHEPSLFESASSAFWIDGLMAALLALISAWQGPPLASLIACFAVGFCASLLAGRLARWYVLKRPGHDNLRFRLALSAILILGLFVIDFSGLLDEQSRIAGNVVRTTMQIGLAIIDPRWWAVLGLSGVLALALFVLATSRRFLLPHKIVFHCDRAVSYVIAAFVWIYVASWHSRDFFFQVAIWLLAVMFALRIYEWSHRIFEDVEQSYARRRWLRRPITQVLTAGGLLIMLVSHLIAGVQPNVPLAIGLIACEGIRLWAHFRWLQAWRGDLRSELDPVQIDPSNFPIGAALVLVSLGLLAAGFWDAGLAAKRVGEQNHRDARFRASLIGSEPVAGLEPPYLAEIFVVSDNQYRLLTGRRATSQTQVFEDIVSSSLRPVLQDMLSRITLTHFADRAKRPGQETWWVHLGDFAENSCASELEFLDEVIERFKANNGRLAGLARGNHDGFYLGNFVWSPEWKDVCNKELLDSKAAVAKLAGIVASSESAYSPSPSYVAQVRAVDGITAVFLDTADYTDSLQGIAGLLGDVSRAQCDWVIGKLDGNERPLLIFGHHPRAAMLDGGRECVGRLIELGRHSKHPVVALVTAHTHHAAVRHKHDDRCLLADRDGRCVPEVVVGSTIDAPQEAAWIRVGQGGELGVETLQPIDRADEPATRGAVPAASCRAVGEAMARHPKRCSKLLDRVEVFNHRDTADHIFAAQENTAQLLFECLFEIVPERPPSCAASILETPLDSAAMKCLDDLAAAAPALRGYPNVSARDVLLCTSWASSFLGVTRGTSLRDAFSRSFLPPREGDSGRILMPMTCRLGSTLACSSQRP